VNESLVGSRCCGKCLPYVPYKGSYGRIVDVSDFGSYKVAWDDGRYSSDVPLFAIDIIQSIFELPEEK